MKVITEQYIRIAILKGKLKKGDKVVVDSTTLITPSAASFMREHGILVSDVPETEVEEIPNQKQEHRETTTNEMLKVQISDQLMTILSLLTQLLPYEVSVYTNASWKLVDEALNALYSDNIKDESKLDLEISEQMISTIFGSDFIVKTPPLGDMRLLLLYQILFKELGLYYQIIQNDNCNLSEKNIFKLVYLTAEEISKVR